MKLRHIGIALGCLLLLAGGLPAQDDDPKMFSKEIMEDLETLGQEIEDLLDVDAMEEELSDLMDLSNKEMDAVDEVLEDFKGHYEHGGDRSIVINDRKVFQRDEKDDEWFEELLDDASNALDSKKGKKFVKWLVKRKQKVDACMDELEVAAAELGRQVSHWAERFSKDIEAQSMDIEEWAESFGKEWEDWGEQFGGEMEDWGEEFGEEMEAFGERLGRDVEKMVKDLQAEGVEDPMELAVRLGARIGDSLDDEEIEGLKTKLNRLKTGDLGRDIQRLVEKSLAIIPKLNLPDEIEKENVKKLQKEIEAYAENVSKAAQNLRSLAVKKRAGEDKKAAELLEALKGLNKPAPLDELHKERNRIKDRDDEIDGLKKEIEELKKELKKLKKEKDSAFLNRRVIAPPGGGEDVTYL